MNITLEEYEDSLGVWSFPCDCGDYRHAIVVTRGEADVFIEVADVPASFWQRVKSAWVIIRSGVIIDGDIVIRAENIEALCDTLRKAAN